MRHHEFDSQGRRQSRRDFIKKAGAAAIAAAGTGALSVPAWAQANGPGVAIVLDPADPLTGAVPAQWAAGELRDALAARGVTAQVVSSLVSVPRGIDCVVAAGPASASARQLLGGAGISLADAPEALALARGRIQGRAVAVAAGSDARGLVYALTELADRVALEANPLDAITSIKPVSERPANAIRSVGRAFASDVEDKPWYNDRNFWPAYLSMLAAQR
ncbi:MAG: twin-arginine translocation signal domain-containing protein, partial [Bryobacteraceae bacterium]